MESDEQGQEGGFQSHASDPSPFSSDLPHDNDSNSKSRNSNGGSIDGTRQVMPPSRMEALMRRVSETPKPIENPTPGPFSPPLPSSPLPTTPSIYPLDPMPSENHASDTDEESKKSKRSKRNFTSLEDDIIVETVRQSGEGPEVWQKIADMLEDRTVAQVKSRFKRFKKKNGLSVSNPTFQSSSLNASMDMGDEYPTDGSSHESYPSAAHSENVATAALTDPLHHPHDMDVDQVRPSSTINTGLKRVGGTEIPFTVHSASVASSSAHTPMSPTTPSSPSSSFPQSVGKGKRGSSAMMSSFLASACSSSHVAPVPTPASSSSLINANGSAPTTPKKGKRANSRMTTPTTSNQLASAAQPSKSYTPGMAQQSATGMQVDREQGEEFELPAAKRPRPALASSSGGTNTSEMTPSAPNGGIDALLGMPNSGLGPVGGILNGLNQNVPRGSPTPKSGASVGPPMAASPSGLTRSGSIASGGGLTSGGVNVAISGTSLAQDAVPTSAMSASPSSVKVLGSGVKMATREGGNFGAKVKVSMTVEELERRVDDAVEEALAGVSAAYKKREEEWQKRVEEEREKSLQISHEFSTKSRAEDALRSQCLDAVMMQLKDCLVEHEKLLRQVNREKLSRDSSRLGYPTYGRNGEEFREGIAGKMLREKERKIEEERGRLEALKKKLVKRRNSVAVAVSIGSSGIQGGIQSGIGGNGEGRVSLIGSIGGSADSALYSTQTSFDQTLSGHGQQSHQHVETASSMMPIQSSSGMFAVPTVPASNLIKAPEREMEEVMRQEQYVKLKLAGLKGKEGEVAKEKEVLRAETQLHYKELRRFSEEEASIFSGYQVLNDRYLMLRLLGRGGFSEVFRAYDLKLYRFVACKIHQLGVNWPVEKKASYLRHAERECEIHTSLVHDRIVSLYDVFEIDENTFCTVMEYCDGGDLDSYLKQNKALPELEVKILASQLFDGLKYLASRENEKMKIIHYDLKPGNLLFDSEGNLKIADFGLSKIVLDSESDSIDLTSQGAGTYWYLPPECFDPEKPKISSKVDVWSAGVIIYQMLFGSKPFGNNISQKIILERNLINHNLKLEFPASSPISGKKVSDDAKSFLSLCLTPNVLQRPDAIQLSSHPFISFNYGSSSSSSSSSGGGGGGGGASSFPSSSSSGVVGSSIFSSSSIMQHHAASHANPTSSSFLPQRNSPHLHQVPTSPGVSAVRVASLASGTSASVATQATIGGGTFTLVKK